MHGLDAGLKSARVFYIAGLAGTSNLAAGQVYGMPLYGTMAHSYIQTHEDELRAFRDFARLYPNTVLLVDTYDTLGGVRHVVDLARELGNQFKVRAIRLDSGDMATLARAARAILDEAGLQRVQIFASGGLDEERIDRLSPRTRRSMALASAAICGVERCAESRCGLQTQLVSRPRPHQAVRRQRRPPRTQASVSIRSGRRCVA